MHRTLRGDDIPSLSAWIKKSRSCERDFLYGADIRIRTGDLILTKDVLYQLSYISNHWARFIRATVNDYILNGLVCQAFLVIFFRNFQPCEKCQILLKTMRLILFPSALQFQAKIRGFQPFSCWVG